jgi:hypothetical protein
LRKIGQGILPSVLYGAKKMNMISTGAFLTEMDASDKQHNSLVKKLVNAWEQKNSKTARAGGVSLMALSLAACGSSDDDAAVSYSQAEQTAAILKAKTDAELVATNAAAALKVTTDAASVKAASDATTAALTHTDGTVFATVDAAKTSGINTSSADAIAGALKGTDGTQHSTVDAAVTSNDTTVTAAALKASNGTQHATVDAAVTSNDAAITTAAQSGHETSLLNAASSTFATVAALQAAYNTATAPIGVGQTFTLTTGDDATGTITGTKSTTSTSENDTFNATDTTYTASDVIDGGAGTDVLNIVAAAGAGISAASAVINVETINLTFNSFTTETLDMNNVVGAAITVNNSQTGGFTGVTVSNLSATSSVTLDSGLTGTLVVSGAGTVNAIDAAVVTASLTSDGSSITIVADDSTNTINLDAASAASGTVTDSANISGVGTITLDPENGNTENVENLTLSGNGAAVSFDITDASIAGNTLETLTFTGSQNVTVTASAAALAGINTASDYTDSATGTVTVVADTTATADLTHVKADVLQHGVDAGATTITIANNQRLELTGDTDASGGGAGVYASTELATGNETLDLELQASQTNNGIDVSDFEVISINVDDQAATTGTITVADFAAGATSALTVTGADNLTITTQTAATLSATAFTGVLNLATTVNLTSVTAGQANDVIDIDADANMTVNGGLGNDAITISHALTNRTITIDGGAGTDTVEVTVVHAATDRMTFTNVEVLDINNNAGTYDARDFSGDTLVIESTGGTNTSLTFDASNTTSVDLSGLTIDDAEVDIALSNITNMDTTIIGTNGKDTVTGGNGNDTITAGNGANILVGGAGADVITSGSGVDTVTGGTGADDITVGGGDDIILLAATGADTGHTLATLDELKDFAVTTNVADAAENVGDLIDISGATAAIGSTTTDANVSSISNGVITFVDGSASVGWTALAADAVTAVGGVGGTDGTAIGWNYEGNGYLTILGSASDGTEHDIVEFEGVTITQVGLNASLTATIATDQFFIA